MVKIEVGFPFEKPFHPELVGLLIALRARSADRRTLLRIEDAELDRSGVRVQGHRPAQRVDLSHHVALPEPSDRRVTGHLSERVEILAEERDRGTET